MVAVDRSSNGRNDDMRCILDDYFEMPTDSTYFIDRRWHGTPYSKETFHLIWLIT